MINISTSNSCSGHFKFVRIFLTTILILIISPCFAQLFIQSSAATNAMGTALGTPMPGTPGANVIFSSAGKVNGPFGVSSPTPCTNGYSAFTSGAGIVSYSASGPAIEITLSPASGYFLSTTGISAKMRHSSNGALNATYAYSTNGGTSWIDNGTMSIPNASCQAGTVFPWNFTCAAIVTDLQTIKVRVYIYNGAATEDGTFQIENLTVTGTANLCSAVTAGIAGSTGICTGGNATISFTGTPSSTITYNINGGSNQTIALNCSGTATLATGALASTTNYNLVSVALGNCSKTVSGNAVVTVQPSISSAIISGTNTICGGTNTNLSVAITGGISPYTIVYFNGVSNTTLNSYISGAAIPVAPTVNTTYTIVSVTGSGGCGPSPSNTGSAIVTMAAAVSSAVLTGTSSVCTGNTTNLLVNITGGVSPYTVVYFNGSSNTTLNSYVSGTAIPVSPTANTSYSLVSVTGANTCTGAGLSGTAVITASAPGWWKGINTNWNDPLNWCDGNIPTATTDVTIPGAADGITVFPFITTTDPQVRNIIFRPGGSISISAAGVFSIAGTTTMSAGSSLTNAGMLIINGTTGLQVFPVTGGTISMANLTINNASGVNMGNSLGVTGTLTLTNGMYTVGAFTLSIAKPLAGAITNLSAGNTSTINIGGTVAGVNIPASVIQLKTVNVTNSAGTVLQGNLTVLTLFNIGAAAGTVDVGAFALNGTGNLTMTGGNLLLSKNAATLPELSGVYNLTGGTITFNGNGTGANAQTIRPVNYFNLTSTSTGDRILSNTGTIGIANFFTPSVSSYTNTGSTVNFNKANNQNIPGFTFNNLTVSGAGNFTKTVSADISIGGTLTFTAGTKMALANSNVSLKSGAAFTATVANIPTDNSITYNGTGRFIVERYIPAGIVHTKSWQLLSVPTTTGQTIKEAWQETAAGGPSDNPNPGFGTQLTSSLSNALALGFDFYTPNGSTIKTYNSITNLWDGVSSTAIPVSNIKGYMLFVRGDRSVTAFNQAAVPTIMRTQGKIYSPGTDAPASVSVTGGKFESVGNPYASAIDLTIINSLKTGDVQNIFYVWDPQLTTGPNSAYGLGGYRTFSFNGTDYDVTPAGGAYGSNAKYIQSGQAFLVKSFSTGGAVNFSESCKAVSNAVVTRQASATMAKIRTNLYVTVNQLPVLIDGVLLKTAAGNSNGLDAEDAPKVIQLGENISLSYSGTKLSVESKDLFNENDTIEYQLEQLKAKKYELEFIPENINQPDMEGFLLDRYLHTETSISLVDTSHVLFEPDPNNSLSYAIDRFCVVFKKAIFSAFKFNDISAARNAGYNASLEWKTENEQSVATYEIEKSDDGINFSMIKTSGIIQRQPGINVYGFIDSTVKEQAVYYRVKAIAFDGTVSISKICKIAAVDNLQSIDVYPNPVVDRKIFIHFKNQQEGKYGIQLLNNIGQVVFKKEVYVKYVPDMTTSFDLLKANPAGIYQLKISTGEKPVMIRKILVQ